VREQFTPDRIEINVVGDFDEPAVLKALQIAIGTLPRRNTTNPNRKRVGYDVLSPADVVHFQRKWPKVGEKVASRCHIESINPNRAFVTMLAPAAGAMAARGSQMLLFSREMMQKAMWTALRKEAPGFSYYCDIKAHHSAIFPDYGHFSVQWGAGVYKAAPSDPLNTGASLAAARKKLQLNHVNATTFEVVKASLLSELAVRLQDVSEWMHIIRGMSLPVPAAIIAQGVTQEPTLKDIDQGNVIAGVKKITAKDFAAFARKHGHARSGGGHDVLMDAVIETVRSESKDLPKLGGKACALP
jgi:predicted Zn-dependent peptidase